MLLWGTNSQPSTNSCKKPSQFSYLSMTSVLTSVVLINYSTQLNTLILYTLMAVVSWFHIFFSYHKTVSPSRAVNTRNSALVTYNHPRMGSQIRRHAYNIPALSSQANNVNFKISSKFNCTKMFYLLDIMLGWASLGAQLVKDLPEMQETTCTAGRPGFHPWVGKIPWRRAWQPTPVFFPGKSHGQRSLAGYSHWGRKGQTWLSGWSSSRHYVRCFQIHTVNKY